MWVYGSSAVKGRKRIYHVEGCIYEKRIKAENRKRKMIGPTDARVKCKCAYCGGMYGEIRFLKQALIKWSIKYHMEMAYVPEDEAFYISTKEGFWKIILNAKTNRYNLYHRNVYTQGMSFEEAMEGEFHLQVDMKESKFIPAFIEYIKGHDTAKAIMRDDYRKLPNHTRKQKKYYRKAEEKAKKQEARRLESLFELIESQMPELRISV